VLVTTTVNFGASPGSDYVETDVSGFTGLTAASYVEAFTMAETAGTDFDAEDAPVDPVDHACLILNATTVRVLSTVRTGERIGLVPIRVVQA
jgi:hypothetical protein